MTAILSIAMTSIARDQITWATWVRPCTRTVSISVRRRPPSCRSSRSRRVSAWGTVSRSSLCSTRHWGLTWSMPTIITRNRCICRRKPRRTLRFARASSTHGRKNVTLYSRSLLGNVRSTNEKTFMLAFRYLRVILKCLFPSCIHAKFPRDLLLSTLFDSHSSLYLSWFLFVYINTQGVL